ncbi:predicted protein [Scheffersomyces stipitis CBS 6054]|uniref:Low temperature requirement A n=1 Tax=Scheffersomyces stipitis (strain ATCC 58785 / CBS 6054 / NBRC 10063 / NRRL Y-11545) TaxID=322104 RepID=A3LYS1_PICST|nr:predicted protein [Scheffersomyces stipitis CBS 6054]ABN68220.1 predicted protein [Scheffersomyces stipitis CBS 6054]KAG2731377.1 hypothetical protein G9P44_005793 [Scheffersomyces stipitis]
MSKKSHDSALVEQVPDSSGSYENNNADYGAIVETEFFSDSEIIEEGRSNADLENGAERGEEVLTDSEGEDAFVKKYGAINFSYIKKPTERVWFIRPHALNYFKDGVLYRTKGERSSGRTELFLDLMYVAIIANLAGEATENASGAALLKYILLFVAAFTIWADVKDFVNYYYSEDLFQKLCLVWYLLLLMLFANSHYDIATSRASAAYTIVPYMLARMSLSITLVVYSFYIPELRFQQRCYAATIFVTTCLWIPVIFISTRAKIGLSIVIFVLEQTSFMVIHHPSFRRYFRLTTSTALNIEHEVERYSVFVTIAVGEFLYKVAANGSLGSGLSLRFLRGVFMILIAYAIFWIYIYGSTAKKAIHALRRSGLTAIIYLYGHLPLVAGIVLAADAGGDLSSLTNTNLHRHPVEELLVHGEELFNRSEENEELNLYALAFFFAGGIGAALVSLCALGLLDASLDPPKTFLLPRFWRVIWRAPVGVVVAMLPFAELSSTVLMGVITALLLILVIFESVVSTPKHCLVKGPLSQVHPKPVPE